MFHPNKNHEDLLYDFDINLRKHTMQFLKHNEHYPHENILLDTINIISKSLHESISNVHTASENDGISYK